MTQRFATTPFGGGRLTASGLQADAWMERRRAELAKGGNETGTVDKFQLLRALTEARFAFGLGDRALAVLDALLTFHQSRELDGTSETVVFPSNRELALRARGMPDRTLRYHLRSLVVSGLLVRRDSPNGKRYSVKNDHGDVERAFGFDLSPLALKATEIFEAAERARAYVKAVRTVRSEITVHLRDISNIVTLAFEEKRTGDWNGMSDRLRALSGRVGRTTPLQDHERRRDSLVELRRDVENLYLSSLSEEEIAANDGSSCRHIQNSNPESNLNPGIDEKKEANRGSTHSSGSEDRPDLDASTVPDAGSGQSKKPPVSLDLFVQACPEFLTYAGGEVRSWHEVLAAAELVRSALGISPDAMRHARTAMGDIGAGITVAGMLERHEEIRSPGGYLRALTVRAEKGQYTVRPLLDALLNARLKARMAVRR